jgi:hypothetical protein
MAPGVLGPETVLMFQETAADRVGGMRINMTQTPAR